MTASTNPPRIDRSEIPSFILFVLERLKTSGHQAYIVGGAVRDVCLGRPAVDWDVATDALPPEIKRIFQDRRHFALKHQTVTLVASGRHYEVTTFRGDPPCLDGDLRRRDFTMNAMALDLPTGRIIDPEDGFHDLQRRILRATADPAGRFREDPLRLLRAVRFAYQFNFRIDTDTADAMPEAAPGLAAVSPERLRDELVKILLGPKPSKAFHLMVQRGLLAQFLPELLEGYLKRQGTPPTYTIFRHLVETVDRVEPHSLLRLAALFHDAGKPRVRRPLGGGRYAFPDHAERSASLAEEVMGRLRFSRDDIRAVSHLVRHHDVPRGHRWNDAAVRHFLVTVGRGSVLSLLCLRRADLLALGPEPPDLSPLRSLERSVRVLMEQGVPLSLAELAIGGETVMEVLGIPPGPRVGQVLAGLWDRVLDRPEWNQKGRLTQMLLEMREDSRFPGAESSSS